MVNRVGVDIFGDGLSHGGPDEVDPMGIVDDAVEDGVGEGGFALGKVRPTGFSAQTCSLYLCPWRVRHATCGSHKSYLPQNQKS